MIDNVRLVIGPSRDTGPSPEEVTGARRSLVAELKRRLKVGNAQGLAQKLEVKKFAIDSLSRPKRAMQLDLQAAIRARFPDLMTVQHAQNRASPVQTLGTARPAGPPEVSFAEKEHKEADGGLDADTPLMKAAKLCSHVMIFTHRPAETRPDPGVVDLTEILIDRVIRPDRDKTHPVQYEFFILDMNQAQRTRSILIADVARKLTMSTEDAAKAVSAAEKDDRLSISFLPLGYYMPPLCVFDPLDPPNTKGFVFFPQGGELSVAQLDRLSLDDWERGLNAPLKAGDLKPIRIGSGKAGESRALDPQN